MGKMGYIGPKIITFKLFSKYFHQIFLKLYLMIDIKNWVKVTVVGFEAKFLFYSKYGKWLNC